MDIYSLTLRYLFDLEACQTWAELRSLLEQAGSTKPQHWQLPYVAGLAMDGDISRIIPGIAAIACHYASIIMVDDMLDEDPKGIYHQMGQAITANYVMALQATGFDAIQQSDHDDRTKRAALHSLNQMLFTTTRGQHLDIQNPQSEQRYWTAVRTKSAPFFGTSMYVGALLGGATPETAASIKLIGNLYGEMIQIHDDLHDVMECPANPDWITNRSPLPILYAQVVVHPERERFIALRQDIVAPDALHEAQAILIRCGAVSYAIYQLLQRYRKAQAILDKTVLFERSPIDHLLGALVEPIPELMVLAGADQAPSEILSAMLAQMNPVV